MTDKIRNFTLKFGYLYFFAISIYISIMVVKSICSNLTELLLLTLGTSLVLIIPILYMAPGSIIMNLLVKKTEEKIMREKEDVKDKIKSVARNRDWNSIVKLDTKQSYIVFAKDTNDTFYSEIRLSNLRYWLTDEYKAYIIDNECFLIKQEDKIKWETIKQYKEKMGMCDDEEL